MEIPNYEMAALCITDQKYNLQGTSNDASSKSREFSHGPGRAGHMACVPLEKPVLEQQK